MCNTHSHCFTARRRFPSFHINHTHTHTHRYIVRGGYSLKSSNDVWKDVDVVRDHAYMIVQSTFGAYNQTLYNNTVAILTAIISFFIFFLSSDSLYDFYDTQIVRWINAERTLIIINNETRVESNRADILDTLVNNTYKNKYYIMTIVVFLFLPFSKTRCRYRATRCSATSC